MLKKLFWRKSRQKWGSIIFFPKIATGLKISSFSSRFWKKSQVTKYKKIFPPFFPVPEICSYTVLKVEHWPLIKKWGNTYLSIELTCFYRRRSRAPPGSGPRPARTGPGRRCRPAATPSASTDGRWSWSTPAGTKMTIQWHQCHNFAFFNLGAP